MKSADPSDVTAANLAAWDLVFSSRDWGRYPPEELIRFIARTYPDIGARKSLRVLEVGCGPGANLWYLAREGFQISAIDGSEQAVDIARRRLKAEGLDAPLSQADLKVGNFASLPWPSDSFDAVIDIEAIYANVMPTIRSAVSEVLRVLKPGGWHFGKMFGTKTSGATSGRKLETRTSQSPVSGVLAGTGLTHAFTEGELRKLFASFSELRLDWVCRSDRNRAYNVFEWLVQARK